MAATPEELALALSSATFEAQQRTETKLRERATNVLSAASIVMPAAGYLDRMHEDNLPTLEATAHRVRGAVVSLTVEIGAAAVALVVTLLS